MGLSSQLMWSPSVSAQTSFIMTLSRDRSVPLFSLGLYLLGILLLPESQANNNTEDLFNQTVTTTTNGNGTIPNMTLSDSELTNLKMDNNMTLITEDDEGFQDWENELQSGKCSKELLRYASHFCDEAFRVKMINVSEDERCNMEEIIRPYHEMTFCLENFSKDLNCFYPNLIVQELFLQIHSDFFTNCTAPALEDAPHGLVITLTLIPVSLIPALVYMIILKNKPHK